MATSDKSKASSKVKKAKSKSAQNRSYKLSERIRRLGRNPRAILIILLLLGPLIYAGIFTYNTVHDYQLRKESKPRTYGYMTDIQSWFNPPGELVYNKLTEDGCGTDPTSWLDIYKVCSYTLHKIYKGSGDALPGLKAGLYQMADHGWGDKAFIDSSLFGDQLSCEYKYTHREGGLLLRLARSCHQAYYRATILPPRRPPLQRSVC